MGEYAPNGQVAFSFACRAGKFHRPSIRVWQAPIPPLLGIINGIVREWILCGGQSPCEHLLSGKLTISGADKHKRFLRSAVRVERRVQDWQVLHSLHSGVPSAGAPRDILMKEGRDVKQERETHIQQKSRQTKKLKMHFLCRKAGIRR